ncbi:beta-L-arabinofuranosidase domain-containing protein [Flavobacterium rhizosphaerae]|uniref:Glycoside hydrolase family 127 protein n=1 Tax=Flavobacterium rhizosphaerae TaxID=3163298 RepID=A0ABW8YUD6_9FLAO
MPLKNIIALLLLSCAAYAQQNTIQYFNLKEVRLLESVFSNAQEKDKAYLLKMDPDRLLAPYLKDAGLAPKEENYPNWESTGLDGHIGGHYISALSLMYAATGDQELLRRVNYMIGELERCQKANGNGYVGGIPDGKIIWQQIASGTIKAHSFGLNDRWVPLYNIHKTYAGLRDAYLYTGNEKAKHVLVKLTDWMANEIKALKEEQIQDMLRSEHGGLNEIFADVYVITGDTKYLELAKKFSHHALLYPLINHKDSLTGLHANMQIPKVVGFKRIADLDHNTEWADAARFFWSNVTQKRSVAIGGNSISEHFNPVDDFSGMVKSVEGPETCNTYNMLKLTKELYGTNPQASYIDYYEKALYNHILTTQNSEEGGFVYFTPMRPGHYRVYSQPDTSFWCCVGSGMENHAKYGEMIYAHTDNDLYVNLFIPSTLNWAGKNIKVTQKNNFPEIPETTFTINTPKKANFTLKLRCPEWTDARKAIVLVNGKEVKTTADSMGYFSVNRNWKNGDVVVFKLPMTLTAERLPDGSDYFAYKYGPVVLAAPFGTEGQEGLFADDSRGGHVARGPQIPLNDIPILLSETSNVITHINPIKDKTLTFHLDGIYQEAFSKGFDLVPFYKIQAERYIIYWPQANADKVSEMQKQQAIAEERERKLDVITVDEVTLGEQQPEADHFIKMEDAFTGYMEDRHYRDARGWFSYQMRNTDKNAKYLYIAYFDNDRNRTLSIEVNGKTVTSQKLEGKSGHALQYQLLPLPESEQSQETLTVKFKAAERAFTAKIIEVRLLTQEYKPM